MRLTLNPMAPNGVSVAPESKVTVIGGTGGSSSTTASPVYEYQNGPDYGATYTYVGYKESGGAWFIYRRTLATNVRQYASGTSNYATNWTNRASLTYS